MARKRPEVEYCPRCAGPSTSGHGTGRVTPKGEPFRALRVRLVVEKRRLRCRPCGEVFPEPLPWAGRGHRETEP